MKYECLNTGILDSNCYILWDEDTNQGVVIDAGVDSVQVAAFVAKNNINLKYIILTHCHFDHMFFVRELKEKTGAKTAIHRFDAAGFSDSKVNCSFRFGNSMTYGEPDIILEDKDELVVDSIILQIIHTPGHSAGSICIKTDDILFTGDTLFRGSVGRTDLPFSVTSDLVSSIQDKLYLLPDNTKVLPGHGPASSIGFEIVNNAVLKGKRNDS
jgi:glyoxylase-like metal-dependent hydrolase (beta-lactamase superfamily II)